MNTTKHNLPIFFTCVALLFATCSLQAGGHHSKPRDIDRAIHIADIVLRALFPSQTIIVESQQPTVVYTPPFYQSTTFVTTPTTVIAPVYSRPVYVAPTYYYTPPVRHNYRPATGWYSPPRNYNQPQRAPSQPQRVPSQKPHGPRNQRRR